MNSLANGENCGGETLRRSRVISSTGIDNAFYLHSQSEEKESVAYDLVESLGESEAFI